MRVVRVLLTSISGAAEATAPLLTSIVVSWFADSQAVERHLTTTRPNPWLHAHGWRQGLGGSLALWALACGAAVVVLHDATSALGPRLGAYPTGIATLLSFALTAAIVIRRRIVKALPYGLVALASRHKPQQNPPSDNVLHVLNTSRSIRGKTWQRIHITVGIGAILPLWWHCGLGRASAVDLLLKSAALLLLTSGFLGVAITDFTRWRLLSPITSSGSHATPGWKP
jgi:hypothetical protein